MVYFAKSGGGAEPLCHYKFDGTLADDLGNEPTLSLLTGNISYANDRNGNPNSALCLDLSTTEVRASSTIVSQKTVLTVEYWAIAANASQITFKDSSSTTLLVVNNNGQFVGAGTIIGRVFPNGLSQFVKTGTNPNSWKKYNMVWNNSVCRLYIDDVLQGSGSLIADTTTKLASTFSISSPYVAGTCCIDDLKIYDFDIYE